jgi:NAD(P)-dependent dehydrogenase (short-subunit alcohol dehydrogenase family)
MSKTVWLITGAGRGMGTDIAKAALAAGNAVVATGRDPERVTAAIGAHDDLCCRGTCVAGLSPML